MDVSPLRCQDCGAYLRNQPDSTEPWEASVDCNGQLTRAEVEYDNLLVGILGDEYQGKTYTETYPAACGSGIEHTPHHYVFDSGTYCVRVCRKCGAKNLGDQ